MPKRIESAQELLQFYEDDTRYIALDFENKTNASPREDRLWQSMQDVHKQKEIPNNAVLKQAMEYLENELRIVFAEYPDRPNLDLARTILQCRLMTLGTLKNVLRIAASDDPPGSVIAAHIIPLKYDKHIERSGIVQAIQRDSVLNVLSEKKQKELLANPDTIGRIAFNSSNTGIGYYILEKKPDNVFEVADIGTTKFVRNRGVPEYMIGDMLRATRTALAMADGVSNRVISA